MSDTPPVSLSQSPPAANGVGTIISNSEADFDKRGTQMRNIVSCSFGKDSIAAALVAKSSGIDVSAVYCHVLFAPGISSEMPEQEDFVFNHAIPKLEAEYGIKTEVIVPSETVVDWFYRKRTRGKNVGKIYGWPCLRGCYVSSNIKLAAIRKWRKAQGEFTEILGIACDEVDRIEKDIMKGKRLILCENGITERDAALLCKKADLLSPLYSFDRQRSGCWFCPLQRTSQLKELRKNYPDLWKMMLDMDKDSPFSFKPKGSVQKYEQKFSIEDAERSFWTNLT